jgi:hypothetical protein
MRNPVGKLRREAERAAQRAARTATARAAASSGSGQAMKAGTIDVSGSLVLYGLTGVTPFSAPFYLTGEPAESDR